MSKLRLHWSLGFLFSRDGTHVALIHKKRPVWQKGYWNGIGGSVEEGEDGVTAMEREFREETGIVIPKDDWQHFATMHDAVSVDDVVSDEPTWVVEYFRAYNDSVYDVEDRTDEEVNVFDVSKIPTFKEVKLITNLYWLLPLALDNRPGQSPVHVDIVYGYHEGTEEKKDDD